MTIDRAALATSETTCRVTVWNRTLTGHYFNRSFHPCGLPTTSGRLCAHHEAERARLTRKGRG